ncbi:hypothetical protein FA15DRAFT_668790 [Coprinopsis marcescibilis]|uniref:BRCT domain-containing protein n=1 Tax=Coprinopsis marcescibilis TaxID=230819 RepID=A0A5C3KYJ1_COPMA|nr:hypothetical protein FA15DRAFT_668790 [Coprinopsis marcescibilis]
MAPAHPSVQPHNIRDDDHDTSDTDPNVNQALFVDPMLGLPLAMFIEKDVGDKDELCQLVTAHGGSIASGYSGVTYILVDPYKTSGQNLYRQYAGKKGKVILDARWIRECIRADKLMTYSTNWAGCKVTGEEQTQQQAPDTNLHHGQQHQQQHDDLTEQEVCSIIVDGMLQSRGHGDPHQSQQVQQAQQQAPQQSNSSPSRSIQHQGMMSYPISAVTAVVVDPMVSFPHVYGHGMHPVPVQGMPHWVAPHMMHPQMMRPVHGHPEQAWDNQAYHQPQHDGMQHAYAVEYRYRETTVPWAAPPTQYYDPSPYDPSYGQATYMPEPAAPEPIEHQNPDVSLQPEQTEHQPEQQQPGLANPSELQPSTGTLGPVDRQRGRKRTRNAPPATPATELVARSAPARSPTPPTRIIKSTYGGNLFTAEDVIYLKKYIDYCQEQGLVLSLREICERIAVKAPHHTFYSWRRYCNKHQIRLNGYAMNQTQEDSPQMDDMEGMMDIEEEDMLSGGPGPSSSRLNPGRGRADSRGRSPTPPRALYRSTTGKGVAFTKEDITYLKRYMKHKEDENGKIDMVSLWKEVSTKAPHHSKASWMKYWRRHKHELTRLDGEIIMPSPPDKKMRYSAQDDIDLAKFFQQKKTGTLDQLFQEFALLKPTHPWKGWQEHHRIHKAKIDHLIAQLDAGELIDLPLDPPAH